ncbi:MAG: histidine kinase [Flavobacteriales bacterium]|nr:histidine kinase [Flavobacteriales bacterium]
MNLVLGKTKIKTVLLHLLFWCIVWLFFNYYFSFYSENEQYALWFSNIIVPITIANTYLSVYYLIPKFLIPKRYGLFSLYSFYVLVGSAYIISIVMFFGFIYMSELQFKQIPPLSRSLPLILISVYLVVIVVSAFTLAQSNYRSLEKNKTLENEFLQAQLQLKMEELKFLRMQIHPHFLFNTLNTLYGFALKKADETPHIILKLSNLLDYILYQVEKPHVLLSEEIKLLKDYLDLEKIRFRDTLRIDWQVDEYKEDLKVAPMLLMPFVENSFKHGKLVDGKLYVKIELKTDDEYLLFYIQNSAISSEIDKKGIGLVNIQKRLAILYPERHDLNIQHSEQQFSVELKVKINEPGN